jgi:hypothetical protein
LTKAADEGLLTSGFFWIPSLGGPTSMAMRQAVRAVRHAAVQQAAVQQTAGQQADIQPTAVHQAALCCSSSGIVWLAEPGITSKSEAEFAGSTLICKLGLQPKQWRLTLVDL